MTQYDERDPLYELDIVEVANEIARTIPGVTSVRLFGSRKYLGKRRSDLDLLISGPTSLAELNEFRDLSQLYLPLDLWLEGTGTATSAVNGSMLPVAEVRSIELFPDFDEAANPAVRRQIFRNDVDYRMTVIPVGNMTRVRSDPLGVGLRSQKWFGDLETSVDAAIDVIINGLEALRRMRGDAQARRGTGTQLTIGNEYDLQNLVELLLSPVIPIGRETYTVKSQGMKRTVDFSLASGRVTLELKFAKTTSELTAVTKAAHDVLTAYLDNPGVELAVGAIGVTSAVAVAVDRNSQESWGVLRGDRKAFLRIVDVPEELR